MKTSIYLFLIALIFTVPATAQKQKPPQGSAPKDFALPKKEVVIMDNGLQLVLVPFGNIPKATISISVKTGNINESKEQVWLSDLLGDLMKEGSTAGYSVKEQLGRMGGNLNISVNAHNIFLSTDVLSEFAPEALRILTDVVKSPKLPESELARLKTNMKRNLTVSLATPDAQARKEFFGELYPNHPYGRVFPTPQQVDSYTLKDVKSFYDNNFGAQRTTIYVIGQFDASQVKEVVKNQLGDWRKGPAVNYPIAQAQTQGKVKLIDRPGAPQSTIYYGLPVPDPSDKNYIALDVMNTLLGGSFGSRITSNIREDKGYTYSPGSTLQANYKSGLWYENADVTTEFTGASIAEIKKEIVRLQNEAPSTEELNGMKNYKSGIYVLRNSSPYGIIGQLNFLDIHNLDESFLVNQVKNINAVTPQQVQQMAKKYIDPERMTLVVVGDREKIKDQVKETIPQPNKKEQ